MINLRALRASPIGVDIGAAQVKAMQVRRGSAGWRVSAAVALPRLSPGAADIAPEVARLADVLHRRGFAGREVVLAVPSAKLLCETLDLPPRGSGAPLEQIARVELARTHKVDPQAIEIACWDLPAPARQARGAAETSHVMAVACQHEVADATVDLFESRGLVVRGLDTQSLALARACGPRVAANTGATAVLDIGWETALLVVVYQGVVVYRRALQEAGLGRVHGAICTQLHLDAEAATYCLREIGLRTDVGGAEKEARSMEAMRGVIEGYCDGQAEEVRMSLSYFSHQYPDAAVSAVLLAGGGAAVPGVAERMAGSLETAVSVVSPRDVVECPGAMLETGGNPALMTALGLAQYTE